MKRNQPTLVILLGLVALLVGLNSYSYCQTKSDSPVKITSAQRTHKYSPPGSSQELTAVRAEDVVLVIEIAGISVKDFQNIKEEKLYLMAGDQRRVFNIRSSGIINDRPKIVLATTVPQRMQEFKLFVGDYPPTTVKPEGKIHDELE